MLTAITTSLVVAVSFCRPSQCTPDSARRRCRVHDGHGGVRSESRRLLGLGRRSSDCGRSGGPGNAGSWCWRFSRRQGPSGRHGLDFSIDSWKSTPAVVFSVRRRKDSTSGRAVFSLLSIIGCSGLARATSCISAPYMADGNVNRPHNSFVEVLAETGLPGLVLYASIFVVAIREVTAVARRFPADWRRNLAGGLLGTLLAVPGNRFLPFEPVAGVDMGSVGRRGFAAASLSAS